MTLNMNNLYAIFSKFQTLIHNLILYENPETIKKDIGVIVVSNIFVPQEQNQQLRQFKNDNIGNRRLAELCPYLLVFFISTKLKTIHVT